MAKELPMQIRTAAEGEIGVLCNRLARSLAHRSGLNSSVVAAAPVPVTHWLMSTVVPVAGSLYPPMLQS